MNPASVQFSSLKGTSVDRKAGVILGASLVTVGPAIGHNKVCDSKTLEGTVNACAKFGEGVKVKLGHNTGVEEIVGAIKNARMEGDKAKGDLHLLEAFPERRNLILELAEKMPETFGLSIDVNGPTEVVAGGRLAQRVESINSIDLVSDPAANPTGLFSQPKKADGTFTSTKTESKQAHAASAAAYDTGKADDHKKAAEAHKAAAEVYGKEGNLKARDMHAAAAACHEGMATDSPVTSLEQGPGAAIKPEYAAANEASRLAHAATCAAHEAGTSEAYTAAADAHRKAADLHAANSAYQTALLHGDVANHHDRLARVLGGGMFSTPATAGQTKPGDTPAMDPKKETPPAAAPAAAATQPPAENAQFGKDERAQFAAMQTKVNDLEARLAKIEANGPTITDEQLGKQVVVQFAALASKAGVDPTKLGASPAVTPAQDPKSEAKPADEKPAFAALVSNHMAASKCTKGAAIQFCAKTYPEAHAEFKKSGATL